ncbi:MAG: hypothetical protein RBR08_16180 [Desulforegulaceae bacterium]|nr:hypothetical protein [Desulforegulaceae bacterium]
MTLAQSLKNLKKAIPDITKNDIFTVPVEILEVQEGFNPRGLFGEGDYFEREDVKQHIRNLADSYKAGRYVPPIVVRVIDGKVLIRDGHCRHRAILLAISEGAEIQRVPVLELKNKNELDENLLILTSNDGLPLSQLERAAVYGRYRAWGWTMQEIANAVGKTISHVSNSLILLDLPEKAKSMIEGGLISASYALELFKEHGMACINIIEKALEKTDIEPDSKKEYETLNLFEDNEGIKREKKATKVTRKSVEGNTKRIPKKVENLLRSSFEAITQRLNLSKIDETEDEFTITITREEAKALLEIKEKLEKKTK